MARVVTGVGNGADRSPDGTGTEGAWAGQVIGTYMHGPVLARNPLLADLLLSMATGTALTELDDAEEQRPARGTPPPSRRRPRHGGVGILGAALAPADRAASSMSNG